MSGIFRYNSSNGTPDKRWTISPFCVSPGHLQDVTTESGAFPFGCRSPFFSLQNNGSTSPSQGRSIREFEEQMAALRKENFNLKLRIYFLEEKIPGLNQLNTPEGQESLMKQYIDNKVETEILRKDLEEKQQILKEAADALTHMENIQKETDLKNQQIIDELSQRIQILEMELQSADKFANTDESVMYDLMGRTNLGEENIDMMQKIRELEGTLKTAETNITQLSERSKELEHIISKRDKTIENLETTRKEIHFQNLELKEILESKPHVNMQTLKDELGKCRSQLADKMCEIDELNEQLMEKNKSFEQVNVQNMEKIMQTTNKVKFEYEKVQKVPPFKMPVNKELFCSINKSLSDSECFYLKDSLDESWIKKLNLRDSIRASSEKIENIDSIVLDDEFKIPSSLSESESKIENSHTSKQITINDGLKYHVTESLIEKLQSEIKESKEDANKANRWRKECADVCLILTVRLEELAGFLDSILNHKEVLNAVASDRRRAMRKAVDKSLDLSRSLNYATLPLNDNTANESYVIHMSDLLENTENLQIENNSRNDSKRSTSIKEAMQKIKIEVEELKEELNKSKNANKESIKKDRRTLLSSYKFDHSESETWSEPDRNVSLARIGLEESSCNLPKSKKPTEQILENSATMIVSSSSTEENGLSRKTKGTIKDKLSQFEQIILTKDNTILEMQCELIVTQNRLKRETELLNETMKKLNKDQNSNEVMEQELKSNEDCLRLEIQTKTSQLNKSLEERNKLITDLRVAEAHIENLKSEIISVKQQHDKHIQSLQQNEKERFTQMHRQLQDLLKENLKEFELKHKESIERDWISRNEYNISLKEIEKLEKKLQEAESTIEYLNENETEMKGFLIENEKTVRGLRKNLDEATLLVSKAILERTKAINEKVKFENKVQDLTKDLESVIKDKNALQDRFKSVKNSGYTSEEININNVESQGNQRLENSSPDLGIESDAGRQPNEKESTPENDGSNLLVEDNRVRTSISLSQILTLPADHECSKVFKENTELRTKLKRTIRQYEETLKRLRTANQLKEQVERDIRQQLHKTNVVLKNVRTNIETNIETIHKKNK